MTEGQKKGSTGQGNAKKEKGEKQRTDKTWLNCGI